ncbi:MAG: serine--tRNA ligase, partial [Candidatus Paceibacterota bacterium]
MLDINFIRDNKEVIKEAARKKQVDIDIDQLLSVDEKRRELLQSVEGKRAEQNEINEKVSKVSSSEERMFLIEDAKKLKEKVQKEEEKLKEVMEEWKSLMIRVPNIPDMSVPEGESEDDNVELETFGEKPSFDFEPKDHMELMEQNGMVDFERGTKVHGFRGYFLTG